jgi:hypothetical protein
LKPALGEYNGYGIAQGRSRKARLTIKHRMRPRTGFTLITLLALAACGGGGSGGSGSDSGTTVTPPPQPTSLDLGNAQAAALVGHYDPVAHMLTLTWSDAWSAGTGFQIEQQQADGTWSKIDAVPGGDRYISWNRSVTTAAKFRVAAVEGGYNTPLVTVGGQKEIDVTPPAQAPSIVIGPAQPISVPGDLSIAGGVTYRQVSYSVDGTTIGSTIIGPDYLFTLVPQGFVAGAHQLQATLEVSPDLYFVLKEQVQLAGYELAVNFQMSNPGMYPGDPGYLEVQAQASSDFGIISVEALQDGTSLGVLTAPNGCSKYCAISGTGGTPDKYVFATNTITAGSGTHLITVKATDGNGKTGVVIQYVVYNNPPILNVSAPFDGALVNGSFVLTGSASTDKSGGLTTVATFNGTQILNSTNTSFSTSYSVASMAPGTYTLVVTSTDAQGTATTVKETVTVTSAPALVFAPLATLGPGGRALAAEGPTVLVFMADGSYHLRSGSTDTALQNVPTLHGNWILSNGNVFNDQSVADYWSPDGTHHDLAALAGSNANDQLLAVHWPWLLFSRNTAPGALGYTSSYMFYNMSTAANIAVALPAGALTVERVGDFYLTPGGSLEFYYFAVIAAQSDGLFRWEQGTGTSTRATTSTWPGAFGVLTDGQRVAWWVAAYPGAGASQCSVISLDIASNVETAVSTTAVCGPPRGSQSGPFLTEGWLSWQEKSVSGGGVKVSDGTSTSALSNRLSSILYGSGKGYVLFEDNGTLQYWNAANGSKTLFDGSPGQALFSGRTAYFTTGATQVLYSVTLP